VSQPTPIQFAAAVRLLRNARKLSIEDLAADAGLHWTTVSRIENLKQTPKLESLTKLATALNLEMSDLARLAAKQPKSVPK
jgi:transcriptional regulator with XRE-family HTH domain